MGFCSFSERSAMMDVTPIENLFLMEYMPTAPEGFVRVYLYARMLCVHPELSGDVAEMARALRMDEETLLNAFDYWEQQGLVERVADRPPEWRILPVHADTTAPVSSMDRDYYRFRDYNAALQDIFGSEHLLHAKQFERAHDWITVFGLSADAALLLLQHEYTTGRGKQPESVFKRTDARAAELSEKGVHTLEEMERVLAGEDKVSETASAILRQLGMTRKASVNELECVRRWTIDWKMTKEELLEACAFTVKSRQPSIGYLDAILKSRREGGDEADFIAVKQLLRELGAMNAAPTPDQRRMYASWLRQGFEPETVLLAAVQCARKRKNSFGDLEWMLGSWHDAGIHTRAEAENYLAEMQRIKVLAGGLLKLAGVTRSPSLTDVDRCVEWEKKYPQALLECAATFSKGTDRPMTYMGKLLSEWEKKNITTPEAAIAEHNAPHGAGRTVVPQQDYSQRSYTKEDFGDDFFYDPSRDYPGEGNGK